MWEDRRKVHVHIDNQKSAGGIGFFGLLQVAFIVLKVLNLIDWSWWMVFLPFWISIGIVGIFFIGFAIFCGVILKKFK
jgi:hypothetical protein